MSLLSKWKSDRQEKREEAKAEARVAFWVWFQENTAYLETFAADTAGVIATVGKRLDAVSPDLAFEMGQADDGVYEFIVSADGIRAMFPEVVALTEVAPAVPGWRVIAFRPRKKNGLRSSVSFQGMELSATALWYRSDVQEEKVDLTLCVEGQDSDGAHALLGPIFLLLDANLGEYDVATRIGAIEFEDCPAEPATAGLSPLSELAGEVDGRFAAAQG
jgi:hypothetical protein